MSEHPVQTLGAFDVEMASTYAQTAIEQLLHVHALANMARSSGNAEYMKSATGWLPGIERAVKGMRDEIEKFANNNPQR